jgi:pimeloyl-ACP methyl ester carboxylesterase
MAKKSGKAAQSLRIPKAIRLVARLLEFLSPKLAAVFAARLFTTPVRHPTPRRELGMQREAAQQLLEIKSIGKPIMVYRWGDAPRKALLVHGWSGRATQLVSFAEALLAAGFEVVSFDAPAHGKSPGSTTLMPEFMAAAFEIEKKFGPFEAAIGHSLGGMALLNGVARGLDIERLVTIGSGDVIQDIIDEFISRMELKPVTGDAMRTLFERKRNEAMDSYSSYRAAKLADIPVLVIHDEDDKEVPASCGRHIAENLKHGTLVMTRGLGHRKILGNPDVVRGATYFIQKADENHPVHSNAYAGRRN